MGPNLVITVGPLDVIIPNALHISDKRTSFPPKNCPNDYVKFAWSAKQSFVENPSPTIDGGLTVFNCKGFTRWKLDSDGFPAVEMQWFIGGSFRAYYRLPASKNPDDLFPIKGDHGQVG